MRLKPLHEQTVVLTGASSGIGLATARLAASRGARLVLVARSERALETLVGEIRDRSGDAIAIVADVTNPNDMQRVADEASRVFGGFDAWVNNAAVSAYGSCLEVSLEDARRIMDTNFWGIVHGSRVAAAEIIPPLTRNCPVPDRSTASVDSWQSRCPVVPTPQWPGR